MKDHDNSQDAHHVPTNDERNIAEVAWRIAELGQRVDEIARGMGLTRHQVETLKRKAEAQGLLAYLNRDLLSQEHLPYLEGLGLSTRLTQALQRHHPYLLEFKIFDSGSKGGSEGDIHQRLQQFSRLAAPWLKPLLKRSHATGVSWGETIRIAVEAMDKIEVGRPPHPISVIPTCGETLGTIAGTASSSRIACLLDKVLNRQGKHSLSLAGIPAMIAQKFQQNGSLPVVQEFLEESPAYVEIFRGSPKKPALVTRIDTVLTSVATKTPLRMAGRELLDIAGVVKREWAYFVGDIGGVLLENKENRKLPEDERAKVKAIHSLWTGIRGDEYDRIAKDAFEKRGDNSGQPPGVIVLAIDENKCPAVLRAIEMGRVNRLACDRHLAEEIAAKLGVPRTIPSFRRRAK